MPPRETVLPDKQLAAVFTPISSNCGIKSDYHEYGFGSACDLSEEKFGHWGYQLYIGEQTDS